MNDDIRRKLDQIDQLFPPERLEASKTRYRYLRGNAKADRLPFILSNLGFDYYDDVMPKEMRLQKMLDECIVHGHTRDDFIPHFFPGCRVGTIPNMFGASEIVQSNKKGCQEYGVCDKLLGPDDDPADLPEPEILPESIASEWLEMQEYVLEETEGRLPISVIDMQGPMDVAAQLWGYENLFIDAMTGGEKSHALLSKCTTAFIKLWQKQLDLLGEHFVGTHLWGWSWVERGPGHGATVSMDSMAMISADFFVEHTKEHLVRISKEFGGLTIHSCGQFGAVIPGINDVPGIQGINATQMSPEQIINAGASRDLFFIINRGYDGLEDDYSFIKKNNLKFEITVGGIWPKNKRSIDSFSEEEWREIREREEHMIKWTSL